jgi:hypothetical protein
MSVVALFPQDRALEAPEVDLLVTVYHFLAAETDGLDVGSEYPLDTVEELRAIAKGLGLSTSRERDEIAAAEALVAAGLGRITRCAFSSSGRAFVLTQAGFIRASKEAENSRLQQGDLD